MGCRLRGRRHRVQPFRSGNQDLSAAVFHLHSGSGRGIRRLEAATSGVGVRVRLALAVALPFAAVCQSLSQTTEPLNWKGKVRYHAESTYTPVAIIGLAAYAGVLQTLDAPREWGKGGAG